MTPVIHVGDELEFLDEHGTPTESHAVEAILLHYSAAKVPESLETINEGLYKTLLHDLSGTRVNLALEGGQLLSYDDFLRNCTPEPVQDHDHSLDLAR